MRALALACSLMFLFSGASLAIAADEPSIEDILQVLKVDEVTADYVIIVDTSKSMKSGNRYNMTVSAVKKFASALAPSDHVTLISFDAVPRLEYSGKAGTDPGRIAAQLPAQPPGNYTDIGAALRYAVAELKRPDVSDYASVILLTDGAHDPPSGSAFPSKSGGAWAKLREDAAKLKGVSVSPYAMGLAEGADAALMKTVFPDAAVVDLPAEQLPGYFDRVKEQSRRAIARELIRDDAAGRVVFAFEPASATADLTAGEARTTLVVRSEYGIVPVTIDGLAVASNGNLRAKASGLPAEPIVLQPGQEVEIPVEISWRVPAVAGLGERQVTRGASLDVTATVASAWEKAIEDDLDSVFEPTVTSDSFRLTASAVLGTSWVFVAGVAAAALFVAFVVWRLTRPPAKPKLAGKYTVDGVDRSLSEDAGGGAVLTFGSGGSGRVVELPGLTENALVIEARRDGSGPIYVYATQVNQRAELQNDDGRWERFSGGRLPRGARLSIGDHRIEF